MIASTRSRLRLIWQLTAALVIAIVVIAGLVIAIVAVNTADSTASCVNDVLGDRNGTSAGDANAHITDAKALSKLLVSLRDPDEQHRLAAFAAYQREHTRYVQILTRDQRIRAAHPLGKC